MKKLLTIALLLAVAASASALDRSPRKKKRDKKAKTETVVPAPVPEAEPVPVPEPEPAPAEEPVVNDMTLGFSPEQTDSLLAAWRERQRQDAFSEFFKQYILEDSTEVADSTPDSVYSRRLLDLASPIQFPYNSIVKGYINRYTNPINDLYALKAIELIGKSLAKAVNNGSDKEAREDVALANTLSGMSESIGGCTSEHAMEHPLSGKNPKLEHGAGLIMLCEAYYTYWAERGVVDDRMIAMAKALGKTDATKAMDFVDALRDLKVACHVDDLKMSDYGIVREECEALAQNARATMGGLFDCDPTPMSEAECAAIYARAYR